MSGDISPRWKSWLRQHAGVSALVCLALAITITAVRPDWALAPWRWHQDATKGWSLIEGGACQIMAVTVAGERSVHPMVIREISQLIPSADGFVYVFFRVPGGTQTPIYPNGVRRSGPREDVLRAFVVRDDGASVRIPIFAGIADRTVMAAQIPPRYSPNRRSLVVKMELAGAKTTVCRVDRLAKVQEAVAPSRSGVVSVKALGLTVSGEAWQSKPPEAGGLQLLAGVVHVSGSLDPGSTWELREVAVSLPFFAQGASSAVGAQTMELKPGNTSCRQAMTVPIFDVPEMLRLSGKLARLKSETEEVDLGNVPVTVVGDPYSSDIRHYVLGPAMGRTASGMTVRLKRLDKESFRTFADSSHGVANLEVEVEGAVPHLSASDGRETPVSVEAKLAGVGRTTSFYPVIPFPSKARYLLPGRMSSPLWFAETAKMVRLKLLVRRKETAGEEPFELVVPANDSVVHRETAKLNQSYGPTGWSF